MTAPKITTFITALVLIGLFAGVFTLFIADLNTNYAQPQDYNDTSMEAFNKLNQLSEDAEETKYQVKNLKSKNFIDIVGAIFGSGYQALKTVETSFDVFISIFTTGISKLPLGQGIINLFQSAIGTIVIVMIFVGVFIAAIVKRDL